MRKIVIDCAGGDNSPNAPIEGALSALEKFPDLYVILCGKEEEISSILSEKAYDGGRVEILNASDVITCHDKPTDAVRLKKDSSMMRSLKLLREDDGIFGMVSTGSTGALVCGATLRIGRIKGVIRPAFCPILPTMDGGIVGICDTGANIDITPEHLRQFAVMGSLYLRCAFGVESPNVGLLNIGTEAEKGDALRKEAYPLLSETEEIRFGGNMEARELLEGKFDLVCCDGFSGNVLIKATEGACLEMLKKLKKQARRIYYEKNVRRNKGIYELPKLRRQCSSRHLKGNSKGTRLQRRTRRLRLYFSGIPYGERKLRRMRRRRTFENRTKKQGERKCITN